MTLAAKWNINYGSGEFAEAARAGRIFHKCLYAAMPTLAGQVFVDTCVAGLASQTVLRALKRSTAHIAKVLHP
jgi:hypothetical protein